MRRDSTHGAAALTFRGVVRVALLSARPCKKIAIAERVTISHAVENDREILIPFAAPRAKTGHDELLMNSLKLLSYRAARHGSVGSERLIRNSSLTNCAALTALHSVAEAR